MKLLTKCMCVALAVLFCLPCFAALVFADWYDEVSGGSYAPIIGEPYVAETFCGVEARYSLTTEKYQCNELIMRFYKEAYGLDVMAYMNFGLIMLTEGYDFVTPSVPKKGDVIYSPAKFRKNKSDHWAIVKDYSGGVITLFEQNVKWNGKAGTGRQLKFPSEYYYIYTPVAKAGYPAPVLRGVPAAQQPAVTAAQNPEPVTVADETSAQPVTQASTKAETSTEKASVTAAPVTEAETSAVKADTATTTAAPTTTAPTSTAAPKPETTAAKLETTAAKPETTSAQPPRTTAAATQPAAEKALKETAVTEVTEILETDIMPLEDDGEFPATATDSVTASDTEPVTEEETTVMTQTAPQAPVNDNSNNKKYMLLIAGAAGFTVLAAAGVALAAFRKRR